VDVFDPSTGAMRTGDVDDIACWFIDADFGQSFFVRYDYFPPPRQGHEGRVIREAQETPSRGDRRSRVVEALQRHEPAFDPPKNGKIAVKVINHFGGEVLKVCPVTMKNPGKGK
jgi:adenine-specific DNA-methyltransferase